MTKITLVTNEAFKALGGVGSGIKGRRETRTSKYDKK